MEVPLHAGLSLFQFACLAANQEAGHIALAAAAMVPLLNPKLGHCGCQDLENPAIIFRSARFRRQFA
jgi:hypothetical protein